MTHATYYDRYVLSDVTVGDLMSPSLTILDLKSAIYQFGQMFVLPDVSPGYNG